MGSIRRIVDIFFFVNVPVTLNVRSFPNSKINNGHHCLMSSTLFYRLNVPLDISPRTMTLINSATVTSNHAVLGSSGIMPMGSISSNPVHSYGVGNIGDTNYTSVSGYHGTSSEQPPVIASGYQPVTSHHVPAYQPMTSLPELSYHPVTSLSEGIYHTSKSNDVTVESKYIYETTPSVNKVQVEGELPESTRPVGPVRAKSAPCKKLYVCIIIR